jgi:hypothetical protein
MFFDLPQTFRMLIEINTMQTIIDVNCIYKCFECSLKSTNFLCLFTHTLRYQFISQCSKFIDKI